MAIKSDCWELQDQTKVRRGFTGVAYVSADLEYWQMGYARLNVTFVDRQEIRMGSPLGTASVKLEGSWTPELPDYGWQDIFAESENRRFLALVAWDITESNDPAFRLVVIDKKEREVRESIRILGCCMKVEWKSSGLTYETFSFANQKQILTWKRLNSNKNTE